MLRPIPQNLRRTGYYPFKQSDSLSILYVLNHFIKINIMKKIFTLLFAVGAISIASAQSKGFDHAKQHAGYSVNEKQSTMQQINREDDYKIAAVRMNRHLNAWEKSKQIRNLENQRGQEIASVQFRFGKSNHQYSDNRFAENNKHKW
jgi:hypothetical protein